MSIFIFVFKLFKGNSSPRAKSGVFLPLVKYNSYNLISWVFKVFLLRKYQRPGYSSIGRPTILEDDLTIKEDNLRKAIDLRNGPLKYEAIGIFNGSEPEDPKYMEQGYNVVIALKKIA